MALEMFDVKDSEMISQSLDYRAIVMQLLTKMCQPSDVIGEIETQPIFDREHDRYLILSQGWRAQERIYQVLVHLDIHDGKIWIQRNQTEADLEADLVGLGIPDTDIIRGLIPREYRALIGLPEG
jgi:hypothetical protein